VRFDVVVHPRGQGAILFGIDPRTAAYASYLDVTNANHVGYSIGSYLSLLDDSPVGTNTKPLSVYRKFHRALCDGITDVIHRFSDLSDLVLKQPFVFHTEMLDTPIAYEYIVWFKDRDPRIYQYILSFLRLLKRGNFERHDLQQPAFREWLANEERLSAPLPNESVLRLMKRVVTLMIGEGPPHGTLFGRHGPGLTSDIPYRDAYAKVHEMVLSTRIKRYFSSVFSRSPDPSRTVGTIMSRFIRWDAETSGVRTATLTFVPKNYKTMRSICMEPSDAMFAQQGVLKAFEDVFKTRPLCKGSIVLEDQTVNQLGAALGSATSLLDTVDLSSASDLVGVDLIRAIFPRKWLYHLLATRTSLARPTKDVEASRTPIRLRKFAPMGSAVCFPVQCIIFLATVYCIELEQALADGFIEAEDLERDLSKAIGSITLSWSASLPPRYSRRQFLRPLVYGDDIVTDSKITTRVMQRLEELRFRVNHSKSFCSGDPVRESCGKYYYDGQDVTPIRLSTPFIRAGLSARHTDSLRKQAVDLYAQGYRSLAKYLYQFWHKNQPHIGYLLGESGAKSVKELFWIGHTVRYNEQLQRKEACVLSAEAIVSSQPENEEFDGYSLFVWQHRSHRNEFARTHSTRVPVSARHRLEWVPVA
jgi:hypothetical protein